MVGSKKALMVAGLSSWAASVVPRARPFVAHLFGAIKDAKQDEGPRRATTRARPKDLIFVRRFRHAAGWLSELLKDDAALVRRFSVEQRHAKIELIVRTDASPFGLGGILIDTDGGILGYWADELRSEDLTRFRATIGDPAWQSEWEFLAVLISLEVFGAQLRNNKFKLQVDNTATLSAAMLLKSSSPVMNAVAAEVSLRIDRLRTSLEFAEHIPGALNFLADALSRLTAGAKLPEVLVTAVRFPAPSRSGDVWRTWPQEWV